ncbi:hypothetical protein AAE478_003619 [Parahypoxylon ruwenzoriense]
MSSLAPGHILPGARWNYRVLEAVKGDKTHASTVFKAEVVRHGNTINAPQWFVVLHQPSPNSEANYDVIDNSTVVLEWLDTTLAEVKYQPDMRTYALIKTVLRAALTSRVVLDGQKYVNTASRLAMLPLKWETWDSGSKR